MKESQLLTLPQPVKPVMTTTGFSAIVWMMLSRDLKMGTSLRCDLQVIASSKTDIDMDVVFPVNPEMLEMLNVAKDCRKNY